MSVIVTFVGIILPYITIVAFFGGFIYRIKGWLSIPVPMPISVTYPQSRGEQVKNIASAILLFPDLFRKDRNLWFGAWPFHAVLAIIIIGHWRLFMDIPNRILMAIGYTTQGIEHLSSVFGTTVGIIFFIAVLYLLVRRITQVTLRNMSNPADYFVLLWLLGIAATGLIMRFTVLPYTNIATMQNYFWGIFTLHPIAPPTDPIFLTHYLLAQLLLISLPFSKLIHPIGIFFTQGIKNSLVVQKQVR